MPPPFSIVRGPVSAMRCVCFDLERDRSEIRGWPLGRRSSPSPAWYSTFLLHVLRNILRCVDTGCVGTGLLVFILGVIALGREVDSSWRQFESWVQLVLMVEPMAP